MPRYLIARRLVGQQAGEGRSALSEFGVQSFARADAVAAPAQPVHEPDTTEIVDGAPQEIHARQLTLSPGVVVEEEKPRRPAVFHLLASISPWASDVPGGLGAAVNLTLSCTGIPLAGAIVVMLLSAPRGLITTVTVVADDS